MRGQFDPFKVSSKNRKEMRKAGTQDEFRLVSKRINEIRKLMRGASLAPDDDPGARDPDTTTQIPETPTPIVTPSAPANPFLNSPSAPANPFLNLPTLPTLPPGPTVLPNPQDQEIQRRLNP
jgi:hypothetical protein